MRRAGGRGEWPHQRDGTAAKDVTLIAVGGESSGGGAMSFKDAIDAAQSCVPARPSPGDVAYIIFTSGSTGAPKGAMITHANALSFLDWCSSEFRPDETDRFASHPPFYFDASVFDLYLSIKHGASVHLVSDELAKRPADMAALIARRRLTFWSSTPSALTMLARFGDLEKHDCTSLKSRHFRRRSVSSAAAPRTEAEMARVGLLQHVRTYRDHHGMHICTHPE